jgi:hypothetical protein
MVPTAGVDTRLLIGLDKGNRDANTELFPLIYERLHRGAEHCMRRERPVDTLQPITPANAVHARVVSSEVRDWCERARCSGDVE